MDRSSSWRILVYQMSDATSKESVAAVLARVDTLTVECTAAPDDYLIVECRSLNEARCVHRMVTLSDRFASLVYRTAGRSEVGGRAARIVEDA